MADPYCYPGTDILINKLNIRDKDVLRAFEIEATTQRISEGCPRVPMAPEGYRQLHHHIFQDVYAWAGEYRTVDISKSNDLFCRAAYVENEMNSRFAKLASEKFLQKLPPQDFAARAAEHLSELNAIHPFREGNGRTNRAFLKALGKQAGHEVTLQKIDPKEWIAVSIKSFKTGDVSGFERIIARTMEPRVPEPEKTHDRPKGRSYEP